MAEEVRVGVTISRATLRDEDLIPAFMEELKRLDPDHAEALKGEFEDDDLEPEFQLEALFDALQEFAPEGTYFGAHPGDGSDFGFWEVEEWVMKVMH
jgi:hypothetical protein